MSKAHGEEKFLNWNLQQILFELLLSALPDQTRTQLIEVLRLPEEKKDEAVKDISNSLQQSEAIKALVQAVDKNMGGHHG